MVKTVWAVSTAIENVRVPDCFLISNLFSGRKNTSFTTKGANSIRIGYEGIYHKGGYDYETEILLCCCR
jgi:hypothetical protein